MYWSQETERGKECRRKQKSQPEVTSQHINTRVHRIPTLNSVISGGGHCMHRRRRERYWINTIVPESHDVANRRAQEMERRLENYIDMLCSEHSLSAVGQQAFFISFLIPLHSSLLKSVPFLIRKTFRKEGEPTTHSPRWDGELQPPPHLLRRHPSKTDSFRGARRHLQEPRAGVMRGYQAARPLVAWRERPFPKPNKPSGGACPVEDSVGPGCPPRKTLLRK